jgi:predicted Zn-dependent protease
MLTPLVENYPDNPLFWLAQGDLFGKLGRKAQALQAYKKAEATTAKVSDPAMHQKISLLLQQSIAALSGPGSTKP